MATPNVVVRGTQDVIRGLDKFHNQVDRALTQTLKQAAEEIHTAVKAIAPVRTGRYRDSIKWRVSRKGLIAWIYASRRGRGAIRGSNRDPKADSRGRNVNGYIGHFLEYGTEHASPRHHWEPVRNYMITQFGPRLEIAIRGVRMHKTRLDG